MNKRLFRYYLFGLCLGCCSTRVTAQQVVVYGKTNWNTYAFTGGSGSALYAKKAGTPVTVQGNLLQGSYKISGIAATTGILPGMKITGTGIPTAAVVTDVEAAAISLSKPVTAASATGVTLTINNTAATLTTAHANGFDGNWPGFSSCLLDNGVHYVFNGATTTPFPVGANNAATRIAAGSVTVNANITLNKKLDISGVLGLNAGNLTIPATDTLMISSGAAIAGAPFSNSKHIITSINAANATQAFIGASDITTNYLFPVGSAGAYLPVTLTPAASASFIVSAFEGVTTNGKPGGPAFSAAQKNNIVNTIWAIARTSANTESCAVSLAWPQTLEGAGFSSADSIGIAAYSTLWNAAAGSGDNTGNTAQHTFTSFNTFAVGKKAGTFGAAMLTPPDDFMAKQTAEKEETLLLYNVYPNPVAGVLTVEHSLPPGNIRVAVYDAAGRMLHSQYTNTIKTQVNLAALKAGIYTVTITDGVKALSKKFVKQ